tara:strand:- start:619 stop:915 length:297 start_codon:yes stop_codon:yes gene_type:complete
MANYFYITKENPFSVAPVVHIEEQLSGSATMTFKDERFKGKVMDFHRVRDAVHHATHNGFVSITRKSHPEYFTQPTLDPAYGLYAAVDGEFDHGCYKD